MCAALRVFEQARKLQPSYSWSSDSPPLQSSTGSAWPTPQVAGNVRGDSPAVGNALSLLNSAPFLHHINRNRGCNPAVYITRPNLSCVCMYTAPLYRIAACIARLFGV